VALHREQASDGDDEKVVGTEGELSTHAVAIAGALRDTVVHDAHRGGRESEPDHEVRGCR
jgi:hypothetical protein